MDPTNRPEAFGEGAHEPADGRGPRDLPGADGAAGDAGQGAPGLARVVRLVAGDYAVTVNPVDGSEIEPCLPADVPPPPGRHTPDERAELLRAAAPPPPARQAGPELPLLHRQEERERLTRLLSRGRSVRLTGPAGSGRSALLDAVADDCADLAPDGVVRLTGYHRTVTDVLYDLFAAVHHAPQHRPDRAALLGFVREIGAVVVLDDLEFGGAALDELLDATPECAFLFSATPDIAAPSADSHIEEVFLGGLDRTACLELLELCVDRPLTDEEAGWAADLWFESEGLPLRFVQAGALLRLGAPPADGRGSEAPAADSAADEFGVVAERPYVAAAEAETGADHGGTPLPSLADASRPAVPLASRLGDAARDTLRFAVALGGEVPHQAHLPALAGDTHADAAVGELLASGLITTVAGHYRLAAGVAAQLTAEGYGSGAAERAHAAAQHYAWWSGHPSVTPERAAAEADAILATLAALAAEGDPGHRAAAVLLARTAAPAFAAALHWSAWERVLRYGQEAARRAGEVGEEAYFHHELGVLALCTGNLQRARAELEASVGMRGVMADKRGAIAGRRALALVADRSGFTPAGPAGSPAGGPSAAAPRPDAGRPGAVPPVPPAVPRPPGGSAGRTPAGEEIPAARSEQSAVPPSASASASPTVPGSGSDPDQVATTVIARLAAERDRKQRGPARQPWARQMMMGGARRNLVAAGAGALLAAVLGTVVTLGITSGGQDGKSPERVKPGQSASQQDGDNGLTADQRDPGEAGHAQVPGKPGKPGRSPGAGSSGSASPGASGSTSPSGAPSTSGEPSAPPSSGGTSPSPSRSQGGKPSQSPAPSRSSSGGTEPSSKPPASPSSPSQPSSPAGGGSSSASGPVGGSSQSAASGPSGSKPADGSGSGSGSGSPSTSGA
ncbi:ATP-binding protein [Streptomyces roseoverticillatus]|uniref:ATP-binding protein n=1 Tax=Streptomyces roseoverticillatus TaxID=66429 RepID=UPI001F374037|nr:ATP-binding protein [Streptomyces roseoverticillatus]MCF3103000.1 ATP-binding protein [Streptomyces roseoverticillatus]